MRSLGGSMTRGRQLGNRKPGGDSADITSNLTAHLLFNDDATDSSGNSNDFTAVNTPTYATGIKGNAIDLERGSSQYVERASFGPSGSSTVSCWVNAESAIPSIEVRDIISNGSQMALRYSSLFGTKNITFNVTVDATNRAATETPIDLGTGTWVHLAGVYDQSAGSVTLYRNGSQVAQTTFTPGTIAATGNMRIGIDSSAANAWDGLIDEFRYYDRALTAADVSALYGGGTPP